MNSIVVENVTKRYSQYRDESSLLARVLNPRKSRERRDIEALKDVTFSVEPGSTLGIVGRNGAGKTTLLKLLSGVSAPTTGYMRINGRIAPLVGIGVGFNQELTGRENVSVNGRLLGMTTEEVAERFDAIVEFSEIDEFIDMPVKFYSSGMFLRLAFSVAINIDPNVALIDEILAVGDVGFQAKCFDRLRELQAGGSTVVVVTHNLPFLQRVTDRTIVLERGEIAYDGPTHEAVREYHEILQNEQGRRGLPTHLPEELGGPVRAPAARIQATLIGADGATTSQITSGSPATIEIEVDFDDEVEDPVIGIAVERASLGVIHAAASQPAGYRGTHGPGRPLHAQIRLEQTPLMPGTYTYRVVVRTSDGLDSTLGVTPIQIFHVSSTQAGAGAVDLQTRFVLDGQEIRPSSPRLGSD